jgi:hypothetical protein
MRGLLQGLKLPAAISHFENNCQRLQSHTGSSYMFYHWGKDGKGAIDDWSLRPFIATQPDLVATINSLGNMVTKKMLMMESTVFHQPGGITNNGSHLSTDQLTHSDFPEFQEVLLAKDMPHILHVSLCKEGMMVHGWPTLRDLNSHFLGQHEHDLKF